MVDLLAPKVNLLAEAKVNLLAEAPQSSATSAQQTSFGPSGFEQPEFQRGLPIGELFSGSARATPLTEDLPEADFSNVFAGEDASVVARIAPQLLTTTDPQEFASIAQSISPNIAVTFNLDAQGNPFPIITNRKTGAVGQVNRPGLSFQDIRQGAGLAAAFTPAGRAASLPLMAARGAATQTAIEAAQTAEGGEFNPEDVALSAAALPAGDVIGRRVIGPAIEAGTEAVKGAIRGGFGRRASERSVQTIEDFLQAGTTPTLSQATGRGAGAENTIARLPGGGPLSAAGRRINTDVQSRLRQIADDISRTAGEEEAGLAIQTGIAGRGGFIDRFRARSAQLWNGVDDAIGLETPVKLENTTSTLNELVSEGKLAGVLNNPLLARIRQATQAPSRTRVTAEALIARGPTGTSEVPYSELRSLRNVVGRRLASNELVSDVPRAELKRLYGALSKDIGVEARSSGVANQWSRANRFTNAGHSRLGDFVERISQKTELDKIFSTVTKGGDGSQTINAFKRSLKPEEWEVVVSNVIRRMGKAAPGQQGAVGAEGAEGFAGEVFSLNKFLTDWNRLGPKNTRALLSGSKKLNNYREDLDAIARVSENVKFGSQVGANPSGTGPFVANVAASTGAIGALVGGSPLTAGGVLTLVAANNGASRLMSNPAFVNWVARFPQSRREAAAHVARLSTVAAKSGVEDALAINSFIEDMKNALAEGATSGPEGSRS